MAEPHPIELRVRVVRSYEAGEGTYAELGERFAVGEASVKRWVHRYRKQGDLAPTPKAGGTPSAITVAEIRDLLIEVRDATAGELTAAYNRHRHWRTRIHVSSMKRALHRHGYVVKKNADGRWRVCGPMSSTSARPS
jgi:transposase